MNEVELRKVRPEDILAILSLSRQTFIETFGPVNSAENLQKYLSVSLTHETLAEELKNENSSFYFAVYQDRNVGYLKINSGDAQTEPQGDKALEIERIYVLKEFQGYKIGLLLMEFAIDFARKSSMEYIWLGVWEENVKAINFYTKYGFSTFDSHEFILGNSIQTDILMKCEVESSL